MARPLGPRPLLARGDADLVDGCARGKELDREFQDTRRVEPHPERDLRKDARRLQVRPANDPAGQDGPLVGFGAWKNHCALYVMSTAVTDAHEKDLRRYDTSKGTVRFPVDKPLPATLVRKIVKARLAENAARKKKR